MKSVVEPPVGAIFGSSRLLKKSAEGALVFIGLA
jgi:hypothetical protein